MSLNWLANILVHHTYIILIGTTVLSGICVIIPITFKSFPNFSDPQMGFETRGTFLSNRLTAWKNLIEATKTTGPLSNNPKEFLNYGRNTSKLKSHKAEGIVHKKVIDDDSNDNDTNFNNWLTLEKMVKNKDKNKFPTSNVKNFCGPPDEGYVQFVLKSDDNLDLFNVQTLFHMCHLERKLIQISHYKNLCLVTSKNSKTCCKAWSLNSYIAALNDRTSCLAITESDVNMTKTLLMKCAKFYHNAQLSPNCNEKGHCEAPRECTKHDSVFNILHFLTSITFLPPNSTDVELKETMLILPMACSTATLPYYFELENIKLSYKGVSVVAMELGIKNTLFDKLLLKDIWFIIFGGCFIILCMWIYTKSIFLTMMTIIAIGFSLGISYFIYTIVLMLEFFPFMNLLAVIVAIGIGADDAFILYKIWNSMNQGNDTSLQVMQKTLNHATVSMFVTSMTTSVAFFSSYFSSITALRCFGVFAGMAVIVNFVLIITWLPAAIVVVDKKFICLKKCSMQCSMFFTNKLRAPLSKLKVLTNIFKHFWKSFENTTIKVVTEFKYYTFIFFTIIGICSSIIVFYYPKLKLPNTTDFQLFDTSHPFEQYDLIYKHRFWFKQSQKGSNFDINYKMPLRFVWGVLPIDNGDYMNPHSLGELEYDPSFNISHPESQKWLLSFCKDLRRQPFYQSTLGPLLPNCFIESFITWMERRCIDPIDENRSRTPCCQISTFPFNSKTFDTCIIDAVSDMYETPPEYLNSGVAGPKFSKSNYPVVTAMIVEYDSNFSFSVSYDYMDGFLRQVEDWMIKKLETAPSPIKGGWFISDFEFYDLQRVLSKNTLIATFISMITALLVLFLVTLNVPNSLFAIFTITCSILTTMALLVLIGWKLNILESVAISSTIGLTIDFGLHYAVNYRLCSPSILESRESAVKSALTNMLGPISMAALTTGAAGAFMMPSKILAYKQIGQFLITVMFISWLYATFHLGSLLAIAGPERQCGQFHYSTFFTRKRKKSSPSDTGPYSISDNHELTSLTSKIDVNVHKKLQESLSGGKCSKSIFSDQSPSTTSAITIIVTDDN